MVLNTIWLHYDGLHSKCQITAMFAFVDISTDYCYVALNASNERYLTFNGHLKNHKMSNLGILTINDKILKNANFAPYNW